MTDMTIFAPDPGDPSSGPVLRVVRCDPAAAALQLEPGEAWVEGWCDPGKSRVEGGAIVPLAADAAALRAEAKRLRHAREAQGVPVELPGGASLTVDVDGDSLAKLTALYVRVMAGAIAPPVTFKGGGAFVALGLADLEVLVTTVGVWVQAGYDAEAAAHAAIEAGTATDRAAVAAAFAAAL
jgi:hypothetical protein